MNISIWRIRHPPTLDLAYVSKLSDLENMIGQGERPRQSICTRLPGLNQSVLSLAG